MTYSLHGELLNTLAKHAPPQDATSLEAAFTTEWAHFVKDQLFPGWDAKTPAVPETERGNAADELLVVKAKQFGVPLITNEENPKGILKRARMAGVEVLTPAQFCAGQIADERDHIYDFLNRLKWLAPQRTRAGAGHVSPLLSFMHRYYQHVLLGLTEGRELPVSVTL